ncbi:MAG: hypothetical protein KU29_03830, partial [Sulfurovum sp. FS06-10]
MFLSSRFFFKSLAGLIVCSYLSFAGDDNATRGICWGIDDDTATLYKFHLDVDNPQVPIEIPISRVNEGEGLAYRPSTDELYMWTDGKTYVINATTGADVRNYATSYANYVEGATFYIDPITKVEELWLTIEDRTTGSAPYTRYLRQVNINDGTIISSVEMTGGFMDGSSTYGKDTGGLAVDPNTKQFWVTDDSGDRGFYKIDYRTGVIGDGKFLSPNSKDLDAEGFSFADDGFFYTESDQGDIEERYIWRLNPNDGTYQKATEKFGMGKVGGNKKAGDGDVEALACNAGASQVNALTPAIDIEKATNGQDADDVNTSVQLTVGDSVTWSYVVKNIGQVGLENIVVVDDKEGAIDCPQTTLDVNETMICTEKRGVAVEGNYTNIASVTSIEEGCAVNCTDINDTDPSNYIATPPTLGSLGNYVWYDLNQDGVQDSNETGVNNVTVTLYKNCNTTITSILTNSEGEYLFSNLEAGSYCIGFAGIPANYVVTAKNQNGNTAVDSDVNTDTNRTDLITLDAGENDITWDMGIYPPRYSLGDKVWLDANKDGIQDGNESGVK